MTTPIEALPPLPEPYKKLRIVDDPDYPVDLHLYGPDQMRAYALAALAAAENAEPVAWISERQQLQLRLGDKPGANWKPLYASPR